MSSMVEQVNEFHTTFKVPIAKSPCIPDKKRIELRTKLIAEEFTELMRAMGHTIRVDLKMHTHPPDLAQIADGIMDEHYVLSGTSIEYGIPEDRCFAEVHRSNMSKADENGNPIFREDGKVLKSKLWTPPDLKSILFPTKE